MLAQNDMTPVNGYIFYKYANKKIDLVYLFSSLLYQISSKTYSSTYEKTVFIVRAKFNSNMKPAY